MKKSVEKLAEDHWNCLEPEEDGDAFVHGYKHKGKEVK